MNGYGNAVNRRVKIKFQKKRKEHFNSPHRINQRILFIVGSLTTTTIGRRRPSGYRTDCVVIQKEGGGRERKSFKPADDEPLVLFQIFVSIKSTMGFPAQKRIGLADKVGD